MKVAKIAIISSTMVIHDDLGAVMKAIAAKDAKNKFGELIDTAQREPVTIEKHGRPVAVIMSSEEFNQLKMERLRAKLAIEELPVVAKCRDCDSQWTISGPAFKCENCDSGSLEIISGRELDIESIEIAQEDKHVS